jgi:hypothetical protein
MKTITVQVGRSQVQLTFPKDAVLTVSDIQEVKLCHKLGMYEGFFTMHCQKGCAFKPTKRHKPVQMDLFTKEKHNA